MKAKLEINEAIIKQALLAHFAKMGASEVTLTASARYDAMDRPSGGFDIRGTVTIDVGDVVAQ